MLAAGSWLLETRVKTLPATSHQPPVTSYQTMRFGIKGKQVLGVTSLVSVVVVILSLLHPARLASVGLGESRARAELLANAVFHRAHEVVKNDSEPYQKLR